MRHVAHPHRLGKRILLALALLLHSVLGSAQTATEGQVKSAYLVNFLKYIEWPAGKTSGNTITVCLFGRDSLGPYLEPQEGRLIGGKELHINKVASAEQLSNCHAVFIPQTEEARVGAVLRWSANLPILTVSDSEFFAREGGGIALIQSEGRLQFEVNAETMAKAGLKPSSQMMKLARKVYGLGK